MHAACQLRKRGISRVEAARSAAFCHGAIRVGRIAARRFHVAARSRSTDPLIRPSASWASPDRHAGIFDFSPLHDLDRFISMAGWVRCRCAYSLHRPPHQAFGQLLPQGQRCEGFVITKTQAFGSRSRQTSGPQSAATDRILANPVLRKNASQRCPKGEKRLCPMKRQIGRTRIPFGNFLTKLTTRLANHRLVRGQKARAQLGDPRTAIRRTASRPQHVRTPPLAPDDQTTPPNLKTLETKSAADSHQDALAFALAFARCAFSRYVDVPDAEWTRVRAGFTLRTLKPGETLLRTGEVPKQFGLVVGGLIRSHYLKRAKGRHSAFRSRPARCFWGCSKRDAPFRQVVLQVIVNSPRRSAGEGHGDDHEQRGNNAVRQRLHAGISRKERCFGALKHSSRDCKKARNCATRFGSFHLRDSNVNFRP